MSLAFNNNYPLYFYGNHCLQNIRYNTYNYPRFETPFAIQRSPIARGAGSTVANQKDQEKTVEIATKIVDLDNLDSPDFHSKSQKLLEEFKRIISYNDRFFRLMPWDSYKVIHNPTSTTGWSLADDGTNLTLDTDVFSLDKASLKFDATVATSGNHSVVITTSTNTGQDLSTILSSSNNTLYLPQWEPSILIPDETEITSIDVRIGSDSSNYWEKTLITTNYEGRSLEQGWNCLSIPHSAMTQIGSPDNSTMGKYIWVRYNYTSATPNLSGFMYGGLLLVQDTDVRNYRCYRDGEVSISDSLNPADGVSVNTSFSLVNYTGYGEGTQSETLFNATGITALSDTQIVQLNGNHDLLPSITMNLNSTTNLNQLKFSNVNTSQFIYFSNTWANGDKLVIDNLNKSVTKNSIAQDFINGKLPVFSPGRNKVRIEVIGGTQQIVNQTVGTSSLNTVGTLPSYQSFTVSLSVATGILAEASVKLEVTETNPTTISIYSDSGGAPGSLLGTYSLVWGGVTNPETYSFYPNLSVNNATKYWIRLDQYVVSGGFSSYSLTWYYSSTDQYAGGNRYYSGSAQSGDYVFKVVVNPTIATNINWGMSYKRLYS